MDQNTINQAIIDNVTIALAEDIGSGDITAQLIGIDTQAHARIISRDEAVIAGQAWVNEVFKQVDPTVKVTWHVQDGEKVKPNQCLYELEGNARALLTGERAALNFLQLLSGVATRCDFYANLVKDSKVKLLDTRKTIPGLRIAQKYAVTCGGCHNHRIGLYDAFLIKENHIMACGSIEAAVATAKANEPGKPVEVEVETMAEFESAMAAGADIIMLDNFSLEDMRLAVSQKNSHIKIEASGGVTESTLPAIAATGVDYISIGTLTKDCKAVDLSMRLTME
jgi:nicotinate-nucleotide pyrophosphorylase (carboxylating)